MSAQLGSKGNTPSLPTNIRLNLTNQAIINEQSNGKWPQLPDCSQSIPLRSWESCGPQSIKSSDPIMFEPTKALFISRCHLSHWRNLPGLWNRKQGPMCYVKWAHTQHMTHLSMSAQYHTLEKRVSSIPPKFTHLHFKNPIWIDIHIDWQDCIVHTSSLWKQLSNEIFRKLSFYVLTN